MRTHLLRTFYPPSTLEPDTGRAANDADGGDAEGPPARASHKAIALLVPPVEPANDEHDDYYLGGYAGI